MMVRRGSGGGGGGGGAGFLTMTIAHGMFPSSQADIEIWFSFTSADLKTVANGGHVVNANHRRFASDSAGTSLYKYDIVTPTATTDATGLIEGWVLVPSGSSSVDTVLYLAYNDNGITTYQGDRTGTWARKGFANHGSEDGSTVATNDYGTAGLTLALQNTPTAVAGKLGAGAVHYVAASSQSLNVSTGTAPLATNTFTVSAWVNLTTNGFYQAVIGYGKKTTGATQNNYTMDVSDTNKARVYFTQGDGVYRLIAGATSLSTGTWYRLVGTYDGAHLNVYLNGVVDASPVAITGNADGTGMGFSIGRPGFNNSEYWNGDIDEPWVDVAHADSVDRILAQYRNQSAPATYITVA
jgi:hypothetical protein